MPGFQPHGVVLAEPLHQQPQRRDAVAPLKQRRDDLRIRLRGLELVDVRAPEGDVARRRPGVAPFGQSPRDVRCRVELLVRGDPRQILDRHRSEAVPELGEAFIPGRDGRCDLLVTPRRRLFQRPRIGVQQRLHDVIQHLDPLVGNAVFTRREQREQPLKTKHIPRIDQRAAVDSAVQIVFRLLQQPHRFRQLPLLDDAAGGVSPAQDFTLKPRRRAGNHRRLTQTRLGIAHAGEQVRQLPPLDLLCSVLGEEHVQRLTHVTEGLTGGLGLPGQSLGAGSGGGLHQSGIELVPLPGHARKQRRQRDV